jgi:hypothetical protein
MNNFYILEAYEGMTFGVKWAYAGILKPINWGDCQYCPVCGGAVSGKKWLPPRRIQLSSSKINKWGDFVWGAGFQLLVSHKFKEVYEHVGLSGIDEFSQPVEIVRMGTLKSGVFPTPPPSYHLIHIPWGGANMDDVASGLQHKHPENITCNYCRVDVSGRKYDRLAIEEGSWNGSDIFIPRNAPGTFMVSEKFKQVAQEQELTNIWLIPAEKYAYDEFRSGLWYVKE